jgi:hypothetical protein
MVAVLLVGGIGLLLGGLLTIGLGIQLDLSFGNTLILAGAVVACTGVMLLGIWIAVRELRHLAQQFAPGLPAESRLGRALPSAGDTEPDDGDFLFSRDQPIREPLEGAEPAAPSPGSPPPWLEEASSRDRGPEPAPASKPRRNLMFSSSSRKERERTQARAAEPSAADLRAALPGPASLDAEPDEAAPAIFGDTWLKSERARAADAPLPRRSARAPSTFTEAGATGTDHGYPAARNEDPPQVTVLKSGVVDGMAYSLYSDGSIEAQLPEGMMRFASIDELRAHLDQRL